VQLDSFRDTPSAAEVERSLERIETSDADDTVRWHAAWMLARGFAAIADTTFLKAQLRDPSDVIRLESVRALGIHGGPGSEAVVRSMLGDASWRVQLEASEALLRLAHKPRTEHLIADPAGLHLPAVPALPAQTAAPADAPAASPSPAPKVSAPDTSALDLGPPLLALTASEMNGPLPGPHPRVLIRTTKGDVVVRLYPEWAPTTVASFLALAQSGFFNGNRWFRIVPDFVVQTGDPTNTGEGDPGYTIPAEENPIEQRTGVISMGLDYKDNHPVRDSAGSQFYITLSPQLHLDRPFSTFGEVESGFDVLAHLIESDRMKTVSRISDG
jgi:cyclophilin family peptidyl-prolyl cis-trans isomerase